MKDKDRRGPPGCRAEPPPRPPLRCGGTRNRGRGKWGGEGSAAPPRLSAPLRVVAAPWPVPVAGARWRSASRHRRAARLHPRGAPRPRCRARKTRAALGGGARSCASPGGVPRSPAQPQGRWKRGAGRAPRCPRVSAGAQRCRWRRGCGLGGSAEALRAALPRRQQDSCDGFGGSGNQTRASGPHRAARGVGVFEDFSPRREPAPAVGMDNSEL